MNNDQGEFSEKSYENGLVYRGILRWYDKSVLSQSLCSGSEWN